MISNHKEGLAYPVPHCSTLVMLSWSRLFIHANSSCLAIEDNVSFILQRTKNENKIHFQGSTSSQPRNAPRFTHGGVCVEGESGKQWEITDQHKIRKNIPNIMEITAADQRWARARPPAIDLEGIVYGGETGQNTTAGEVFVMATSEPGPANRAAKTSPPIRTAASVTM